MVSHLLLAMSAHFQFAGHAMSMRERMGISLALSAKPDTRDIKEVLPFVVMEKRMVLLMMVVMISITQKIEVTRRRFRGAC
jgi:hypothetical protein